VIDLEAALVDLGEHLDHPDGAELVAAVRGRIATPGAVVDARRRFRTRSLVAVAAVVFLLAAAVLTIAPARRAVADWLGIGAVEIRHSDHPLPNGTGLAVPGAPGSTRPSAAARELAAARRVARFDIKTPRAASAGALLGVEIDRRVPGGLVVLRYPRFTLIEIASHPDTGGAIRKFLDRTVQVEPTTVAGHPGLWIAGVHQISYLDRDGNFASDTIRRSGPVLLWTDAGVTYRIEGFGRLQDAMRIATSVR
jgi:hypothetical protein